MMPRNGQGRVHSVHQEGENMSDSLPRRCTNPVRVFEDAPSKASTGRSKACCVSGVAASLISRHGLSLWSLVTRRLIIRTCNTPCNSSYGVPCLDGRRGSGSITPPAQSLDPRWRPPGIRNFESTSFVSYRTGME